MIYQGYTFIEIHSEFVMQVDVVFIVVNVI